VVVVVVVFIAGLIVGVAGDHFYLLHSGRFSRRATRISADRMADHLGHELQLSPQQKTQVQQIIERHRAKIDATMASVRPQVRQEVDATNADIDRILTPEQRTKFAAIRMRIESRRRDRDATRAQPARP
jgi:hypothetical protein